MHINIQHHASDQSRALLRHQIGSRLCAMGAEHFRTCLGGSRELGYLGGFRTDQRLAVVLSEPILHPEVLSFPGIEAIDVEEYHGLWSDDVSGLAEVTELLEVAPTSVVTEIHLLRDQVRWRSRPTGDIISIETDIGVLTRLGKGDGWFLVLARDSELGILQFGYASTCAERDWWFSSAAIIEHWAFVEGDDGQEVLSANRSLIEV